MQHATANYQLNQFMVIWLLIFEMQFKLEANDLNVPRQEEMCTEKRPDNEQDIACFCMQALRIQL